MEETLEFAGRVHAGKPQLPLALRLIQHTGVRKRHIVQPIEKTLRHPGLEERNRIYELEFKKRCPDVIERAVLPDLAVRHVTASASGPSYQVRSETTHVVVERHMS